MIGVHQVMGWLQWLGQIREAWNKICQLQELVSVRFCRPACLLRQQQQKATGQPYVCLADYIAPADSRIYHLFRMILSILNGRSKAKKTSTVNSSKSWTGATNWRVSLRSCSKPTKTRPTAWQNVASKKSASNKNQVSIPKKKSKKLRKKFRLIFFIRILCKSSQNKSAKNGPSTF